MAKTSQFKCHCVEGESKINLEYGRGWRLGDRWKDVVIVATSSIHLFLVLYFVIIIVTAAWNFMRFVDILLCGNTFGADACMISRSLRLKMDHLFFGWGDTLQVRRHTPQY